MTRKSTVHNMNLRAITKMVGELQLAITEYAPYASPERPLGEGSFDGDFPVIYHAIQLRDYLDKVIKASKC